MKVFYHTWKHGFEQTILYHGRGVVMNHEAAVMVIEIPVLDSGLGLATVVQLINTDEVTIEQCEDCEFHDETVESAFENLDV